MRTTICYLVSLSFLLSACEQTSQQSDAEGVNPLISAAETGDLTLLDQLIEKNSLIDVRDQCEWTPLMKAALNGHLKSVQSLLLAGAEPNLTEKGGYSPLMLAASNNHSNIVRILLEYGANANQIENTNGWTALIWAAKQGHQKTIKTLLQHRANTNHRDYSGKTAKDWALEGKYNRVIDLIDQSDRENTS